jgi:hypothetical protein
MALPLNRFEGVKRQEVDPRKQYIAVQSFGLMRGARKLPQYEDSILLECTPHTFEQMACDPEVSAALWLLVYFILADGVTIRPAVPYKDPGFARATDIHEHCQRTLENLSRPLKETLEQLIGGSLQFGNKIAEKVYDIPTTGPDAFKLVLTQIKVKPRGSTSFVVDEFMNLLGLSPTRALVGETTTDQTRIIPLDKFVIATYRMRDEDPRGNSLFRAAVKAWKMKQLSWPEFYSYLMRYAIPSLFGTTSPDARDDYLRDSEGNPVLDSAGNKISVSAVQLMLNALMEFKNASVMAAEHGADIKPLEVAKNGEAFDLALSIFNREIRKGLLLQELATSDSEHQTRASTSEQMDIVELLVWSGKMWAGEIVRSQILAPQVALNYGEEDARDLTPLVALGDYDRKDWAVDANAAVALVTATVLDADGNQVNALTYSQIQALFTQIGLPSPTEEEVEEMRRQAKERRLSQEDETEREQGRRQVESAENKWQAQNTHGTVRRGSIGTRGGVL